MGGGGEAQHAKLFLNLPPTLSTNESCFQNRIQARLAQPVERKALNLVVVGSSPTVGALPNHSFWTFQLIGKELNRTHASVV